MIEDGTIRKSSTPSGGISVRIMKDGEWIRFAGKREASASKKYLALVNIVSNGHGAVVSDVADRSEAQRVQSAIHSACKRAGLRVKTAYNAEQRIVLVIPRD